MRGGTYANGASVANGPGAPYAQELRDGFDPRPCSSWDATGWRDYR